MLYELDHESGELVIHFDSEEVNSALSRVDAVESGQEGVDLDDFDALIDFVICHHVNDSDSEFI